MSHPVVSIIIPTLNEEKYIEPTLISLTNQIFPEEYEIIIADGGSTDRTVEIAKKYTEHVVYEEKRTIASGRKKGVSKARGDIIVSAGADIIVPNFWLSEITKPLMNGKPIAACIGKVLPKDGTMLEYLFTDRILGKLFQELCESSIPIVVGDNMAFKKDLYELAGGFNEDLITGEDIDLIKRIKDYGEITYNEKALAHISIRRVREWGYSYYIAYHSTNFLRMHLFNSSHKKYEPIR